MNDIFGTRHYGDHLRITYVSQGWLIVWDHVQVPPIRYDFQNKTHHEACVSAVNKLHELANA